MLENVNLKEKNIMEKVIKMAETRMVVYIYIYIVYCHLENKCVKYEKNKNINKDRTILKCENNIALSLCALCGKISYKYQRAGPRRNLYLKIEIIRLVI